MKNNDLVTKTNSIFFDPFFDPFFDFDFPRTERNNLKTLRTDIVEEEDSYVLSMQVPGYKKEDINLDLENGYLTITASKESKVEDTKKYLRREISYSTCKRSFYVGDNLTEDDISASMKDGILEIKVMKKVDKPKETKRIEIK